MGKYHWGHMIHYQYMSKNNEFHIDFELPTVESKASVRKVHISDSVCESCEG